ncbi:MAG TPA: hypothetical protein VFV51_13665, partial [Vicinamibacterales bacterium]|nr:hypothetical protein [Vicinamibacterales bacterium]
VADIAAMFSPPLSRLATLKGVTRTFWISFCDSDTGKNIGICVVEVTSEQAEEAIAIHRQVNPHGEHPTDEWMVAAIGQTLLMECNPGGEVAMQEVVDPSVLPPDLPRNRLIQEDELKRNGWD